MDKLYLAAFALPFEEQSLYVWGENGIYCHAMACPDLSNKNVVLINSVEIFSNHTNSDTIPDSIFDVNVARRILAGKSTATFGRKSPPWKGVLPLARKYSDQKEFIKLKELESGEIAAFDVWLGRQESNWSAFLIQALIAEYQQCLNELSDFGLLSIFENLEMELLRIFLRSGINGININHEKLAKHYDTLDYDYYSSVFNLEINHKFVIDRYSRVERFSDISSYVPDLNAEDFGTKNFWSSVKLYAQANSFLGDLLVERNCRRDRQELLRLDLDSFTRLSYDIFGTVSGRILVRSPGIQYLKKASRQIFEPRDGFEFIYLDYEQFEPAIIGSISGDEIMCDAYNAGDIYKSLASEIGNGCTRDIAKTILLSYIYGMKISRISRLILDKFGLPASQSVELFISKFSKLEKWKADVSEMAIENGLVKNSFGYFRRKANGEKDYEINRWAPNFIIQSTGAVVFKKALLEISRQIPDANLLVPIHDAILIECEASRKEEITDLASKIMKSQMESICHGISPRVSLDDFSGIA